MTYSAIHKGHTVAVGLSADDVAKWQARKPQGVTFVADAEPCRWFLACDRPATGSVAHPILGDVPTCDRCRGLAGA